MYADNVQTMKHYLAQLVLGGDFADIPMRQDVCFTGPLASATGAEDYRAICQDFADSVEDIQMHTLVGDDEVVHVVYNVDMGLPNGPLRTSQTVTFVDGAFASVDVIFDTALVGGPGT